MSSAKQSVISDYFDLDDILATQERVSCKTEMTMYRLGFLDPNSDNKDIVPGTKMELPYWSARALCSQRRKIVSVEFPKQYRVAYRDILQADATVVNLHKLGPYFYRFGTLLLNFHLPGTNDIAECLLKTFQSRFRKIMDSSQNCLNEDVTALTEKLDEMEKVLFQAGQQGLNDFQKWETRQAEKLTTSEMVRTHRKRKRPGTSNP